MILNAFHPRHFDYPRFALALCIGLVGALVFLYFRLPLAWMLGSMLACTVAALLKLPVAAPAIVRPPMTIVLGVLLGAGFSPEMILGMVNWVPTILGLIVFVAVSGLVCVLYFRKVGGYDMATAYFAGMPGGLVEMVLLGQEKGGDPRRIALIHSIRILLTVSSLPLLIPLVGGAEIGARPPVGVPLMQTTAAAVAWLVAAGIVGAAVGHRLRFPAYFLLGPMVASAIVHLLGWTHASPPREIIWIAQLVLGVTLGCRFVGIGLREMARTLLLSVGSTGILFAMTILFALALSTATGLDIVSLVLAYAPGGLIETSFVALALQIEVAFVATHHIIRVFLVMTAAGLVFRLIKEAPKNDRQG